MKKMPEGLLKKMKELEGFIIDLQDGSWDKEHMEGLISEIETDYEELIDSFKTINKIISKDMG